MNAITPIPPLVPSIIPENAPFSAEQRAWLNGFFAAYLGLDGPASSPAIGSAAAEPEEHFPWHDAALAMPERLELAKDRKPERQLMAAMAQLDCGQCGYLCQTYAEAVWSGAEGDLGRCVPGGKETQRKLKEMMATLESQRDGNPLAAPAVKVVAALGTRDRPALATLVDAYPLTRPGSEKDVRHVVFDLSTTDLTYEAGDSLGVYARKNPQLVQAVLDRLGASGEGNEGIVFWYSVGSVVLGTGFTIPVWVTPDAWQWAALLGVGVIATLAQLLMTEGYRTGEATLLAPFEYISIVYTSVIGMVFWGEFPDRWSLAGIAVIVGSGLYVWHRETRAGRAGRI